MQFQIKSFIVILLVIFASSNLLHAQAVLLQGYVLDEESRAPIPNATVQAVELDISTVSNQEGYFEINLPQKATYLLEVRHVSYRNRLIRWPVSDEALTVFMEEETAVLEQIEVKSSSRTNNSLQPIEPIEVNRIATPFNEFNQLLSTFAGVVSNNELSSSYAVRGGNFDENLIYVNGIEVYRPFLIRAGQQEGLSFVNPDLVKSIQFSAGGWEAQYGDKLSSNLLIEYKDNLDTLEASVTLGLLGSSAYLGSPVGEKGNLAASARYKNARYLFNTFDTEGEYLPEFFDVQAVYHYDFSKETELDLIANYAQNEFFVEPASRETDFGAFQQNLRFTVGFQGAESLNYRTLQLGGRLNHRFSEDLQSSLSLSYFNSAEFEFINSEGAYRLCDIDREQGSETFDECINVLGIGSNLLYARNFLNARVTQLVSRTNWQINGRQLLSAGLDIKYQTIDDRLDEFSLRDSADFSQVNRLVQQDNELTVMFSNAYMQHEWSLTNNLLLVSGLRLNYSSLNKDLMLSPRFQLSRTNLHSDNSGSLSFSTGIYRQFPFYRELRDYQGALNLNLRAQTAIHFILGYDKDLKIGDRDFKLNTSAYYKYLQDIIPYDIDNVRVRYLPDLDADGYAYGADFRLTGEFIPNTQSWINLSLLSTKERIEQLGDKQFRRPSDQRLTASIFFQDHFINDPSTTVNLRLLLGSGLPFGPPRDLSFRNSFNGEWYRRLDLGFSKELNKLAFLHNSYTKRITIGLDVLNVLGVSNAISYNWIEDFAGRQFAIPNSLSTRFFNFKISVDI